jgi:hypothetical protein
MDLGDGGCSGLDLDTEISIYDTDGITELVADEDDGVGWCSLASITASAAGTYYVRAASSSLYAPNDVFNYLLLISIQ